MPFLNTIKQLSIQHGGYIALRWLQDSVLERSRLEEFRTRVNFYQQLLTSGDLCFDVGSNIGDISAVLLQVGAKVIAIDPQPMVMKELAARLGRNPNLTCLEIGLASVAGDVTLYLHDKIGTTSMLPDWNPGSSMGSIRVAVTTLDDVISRFGVPKYCKIDVEGFELDVLRGLTRKLDLISFEYHSDPDNLKKSFECLDLLERHGPIIVNVVPFGNYRFNYECWKSRREFEKDFLGRLRHDPAFAYGDIFVKR